jgi:putative endonuclease
VVYYVNIMASSSGVLYIGITNNLELRVSQHKLKLTPGFSFQYNTTKLVYFDPFSNVLDAIACEKQLNAGAARKRCFLQEKSHPTRRNLKRRLHPS